MVGSRFMAKGKVAEITPWYVTVEIGAVGTSKAVERVDFNKDGVQCDGAGEPFIRRDKREPGPPEDGIWELTDDKEIAQRYEDGVAFRREQAAELRKRQEQTDVKIDKDWKANDGLIRV